MSRVLRLLEALMTTAPARRLRRRFAPRIEIGIAADDDAAALYGSSQTATPDSFTIVARLRGSVVGAVIVGPMWPELGVGQPFAGSLLVRQPYRGLGIGRRLVTAALREASARGLRELWTNVGRDNGRSRRLFESLGFWTVEDPAIRMALDRLYLQRVGRPRPQILYRRPT